MRRVGNKSLFTPLGLWIREHLRDPRDGLCVTNLDYVLEDFRNKRLMILEEKQHNARLAHGQRKTFKVLDEMLRDGFLSEYDYWGFFALRMSGEVPGPGMTLNGKAITVEQLTAHLDFRVKFCEGMTTL